jgi:hypothetical protein
MVRMKHPGRRDARLNRAAKGLMNQERRAKNKDRASDPGAATAQEEPDFLISTCF